MKNFFFVLVFLITSNASIAQEKPKLVVGIIVDQMRHEYIHRFEDKFSDTGFKRLMNGGFTFENAHYNYMPTYTAPGHASVYTGTTPAIHGIIGNNWYNKVLKKEIYCAEDSTMMTIGSDTDNGEMSPNNLLTTTITDELRLFTQKRSQVIGISIKDRGAIFPAGHTGSAYWYDKKTGDFITSSYYENELSGWVKNFNKKKRADYYLKQTWDTYKPIETYLESGPDQNNYEAAPMKENPTFPYTLEKGKYWMVPGTPFGNDILAELAIEALNETTLGEDETTDFLAISFSSTDYIGHSFGPNSKEIQDTYLRLDQNLSEILKVLDEKVGAGNYTVFLTADHAVADVPQYMIDNKVPAGYFQAKYVGELKSSLNKKYGEGEWIEFIGNEQIFLNRSLIEEEKLDLGVVQKFVAQEILKYEGIAKSYPANLINAMDYNTGALKGDLVRGYNQKRSGDVLYIYEPGWMWRNSKGTTHHSPYNYDTHVPIIFYGKNIKSGKAYDRKVITQIAPTIAMMLGIKLPNSVTDEPLVEILH